MTATLPSTASFVLPPSQKTASVLEFKCLYTHDLRRKQKRFQDGFLSYHTFNKRVMVYDDMRHFIGDTHWKQDEALQDGDELHLDKGVIVQVEEALRTTQTDLAPLLQRNRPDAAPQDQSRPRAATRPPQLARNNGIQGPSQSRHKSLTALLGTPRGSLGRAVLPTKSPYEVRHADQENEWPAGREAKRVRLDSAVQDQHPSLPRLLQGTDSRGTLSSGAMTGSRIARIDRPALQTTSRVPQQSPTRSNLVDLTQDDIQNIHSDVTLPPDTPSHVQQTSRPKPKATKPVVPARTPSPHVSIANRFSAAELSVDITAAPGSYNSDNRSSEDMEHVRQPPQSTTKQAAPGPEAADLTGIDARGQQTSTAKKTATLRIASKKSKSILLCQTSTPQIAASSHQQLDRHVPPNTVRQQTVASIEPALPSTKSKATTSSKAVSPTPIASDNKSDDEWAFQTQPTPEKLKRTTTKLAKQRQRRSMAAKDMDSEVSKAMKPSRKRRAVEAPEAALEIADETPNGDSAEPEVGPFPSRNVTFPCASPAQNDAANENAKAARARAAKVAPTPKALDPVAIPHHDDDFPTSSLLDAIAANRKNVDARPPTSQPPGPPADAEQAKVSNAHAQGKKAFKKPMQQFSKRAQRNIEMRSRSASLEAPTPPPAKPQGIFDKAKGDSTVISGFGLSAGKDGTKAGVKGAAKRFEKPTSKEPGNISVTATKTQKVTKAKSTSKAQRQEGPALDISKDENIGPWSVEAFDLFDYYRPPDSNMDVKWFGASAAL